MYGAMSKSIVASCELFGVAKQALTRTVFQTWLGDRLGVANLTISTWSSGGNLENGWKLDEEGVPSRGAEISFVFSLHLLQNAEAILSSDNPLCFEHPFV